MSVDPGQEMNPERQHQADAVQRLAQAQQDREQFMARISHELRTPLNAVLSFARLMQDDLQEPPTARQAERLTRIADGGSRLLALVDDILEHERLEHQAFKIQAVQPAWAAHQALLAVAEVAREAGVTCSFDAGGTEHLSASGPVLADPAHLVRALSLLLKACIRRESPGSGLTLTMQSFEQGAWRRFCIQGASANVSREQHLWLFEAFAPAHAGGIEDDATPLHLSLARRLVQAMGGRVQARKPASEPASQPASGPARKRAGADAAVYPLVFELDLPAHTARQGELDFDEPATQTLNLLCVEDNPSNLQLVQELVALKPHIRLHTAVDCATAMARVAQCQPDAALVDIHLPDGNGIELMQRLRRLPHLRACSFVALSADVVPAHIERALAAGFDEYWTKPIQFPAFLQGLERLAQQVR